MGSWNSCVLRWHAGSINILDASGSPKDHSGMGSSHGSNSTGPASLLRGRPPACLPCISCTVVLGETSGPIRCAMNAHANGRGASEQMIELITMLFFLLLSYQACI